jgi:hypothetical protein
VAARDAFLRKIDVMDCGEFAEGRPFVHAFAGIARLFEEPGPVPARLASLDPDVYAFRPARSLQVMGGRRGAALVRDEAAADGWALRIPGHATGHVVRCPVDPDMRSRDRGACYVRLRVDALDEAGPACAVGTYDRGGEGRVMRRVVVNIEDLDPDGYTDIFIPRERPKMDRYYYVEPLGNPEAVNAVLVEGVYLLEE